MPTFGSLFSGIGGLDLGLERAGWECRWQVENDPFCVSVLERHWPGVTRHGDIRTVDWDGVEPVDLVCGGFPCQPVSVAGRQKAQEDGRWLWPEFARALRRLRPGWVLVENVPGLLSVNGGAAADEVFGDLAVLGFDAEWASIPAAAVGAPHLRYRIFIVAHTDTPGPGPQDRLCPREGGAGPNGIDAAQRLGASVANAHRPLGDCPRPPGEAVLGPEPVQRPGRCGCCDGDHWAVEPGMGRVAHGVPARVDRLRALGNAVVPQVAQWVGERILAALRERGAVDAV